MHIFTERRKRDSSSILNFKPTVTSASKFAQKNEPETVPQTSSTAHDFSQVPLRAPEPTSDAGETNNAQVDCPPGMAGYPQWRPGHHITPQFLTADEIKQPPQITSGYPLKQSITSPWRAPTITGRVVADCKNQAWRYQLTSFLSGGSISIYYYTSDHYPAPGPPYDDKAPLTNVTKQNWKEIVAQLDERKASAANFWDAYQSQDLHEEYHWNVHWKGVVKPMVFNLEKDLEALKTPFIQMPSLYPMPASAAQAEAILEPKMQTLLANAYKKAVKNWEDIPDDPGDTAYQAQIPAFKFLIKRVKDYAKSKGW